MSHTPAHWRSTRTLCQRREQLEHVAGQLFEEVAASRRMEYEVNGSIAGAHDQLAAVATG